ncbi:hypothetical protein A3A93_00915 [Candidatus Roizmanbacteria bacterium RIFCSPLOWO2_01_FULL_38_12]|uniref:Homing endonuclease LAGLIDADG domain-containing protein n=1 Tax=Candidatus Roizmanbacteria bacterium RIFCSPLOWO2_01_FULL_38_12 TaxID=1802061 RepID=A0A1F7IR70_9BACT|nr:MAG: hypothetical protein A3F59_05495 [Candidatus Roizmanbacteria bacterium RIFCSPHIGHO2_12_FULL_38_13]OGK45846.1 MAG: hypothetical protein A3A93_00915 [Candidatus Roizmanbacteria bacterium RIFCSPLOWO2_01_FULL_38_12]
MVEKTKAYIAGFLDGDGSIFLQLVRRKDYQLGYQIRASIVFFQKKKNDKILRWLKHKLRYGYLRNRKDGLSEYTIVGFRVVKGILNELEPYLLVKKYQAKLAIRIIDRIEKTPIVTTGFMLRIAKEVDKFGMLNNSKKRINDSKQLKKFFQSITFDPVSTEFLSIKKE